MSSFDLTILGCSSATPTSFRNPTAQILNISERFFLIDCGEGTQMAMRRFKVKFSKINHIFISHLHGDHFFGLVGLLSSFHLLGRTNSLEVFGPKGLKEIVEIQFKYSDTRLRYQLNFIELDTTVSQTIFEDNKVEVKTIPLSHRIPCNGYLFMEKPLPKGLKKSKVQFYNIPIANLPGIKRGDDFITEEGKVISNADLTVDPPPPRSYAFCSDTIYLESIVPLIKGVDLLYHEATFMQDMQDRAKETYHSTTIDAANIALRAEAKKLVIGHYSARYRDLDPMLAEAKTVFPETELALDGKAFSVAQQEWRS